MDTVVENTKIRVEPSLSVRGTTTSADTANPARYAENIAPACVLFNPHSS